MPALIGNWVEDQHVLEEMIQQHFKKNTYSKRLISCGFCASWGRYWPCASWTTLTIFFWRRKMISLLDPFSQQEIKDVMFNIADDKLPGLDGFTAEF